MSSQARIRWRPAAVVALLLSIVALGVLVRWEDPASTTVIPAEDPYTHMALVRSHLADGDLDPLVSGGTLYPPGMHAVLATAYAFTGSDLSIIFRFGPVFFGAIGIIGIALLLWRHATPTAAVVGSLGMALAPELVFRTTMMAPTAVDLALLPFLLLATLELMRGHRAWGIPLGLGSIFLILAHPWALMVVAPVTIGLILMASALSRRKGETPGLRPGGTAIALGISGLSLYVATSICWNQCGLGFQNIGDTSSRLDRGALLVSGIAAAMALAYGLAARRGRAGTLSAAPPWLRGLASLAAVGALVGITLPATQSGMPQHVNLLRMFGWPVLVLAAVGFAAAPLMRWPAGWVGAAIAVVTYPFVIYNPLASPFWPHRTAAYLGMGLVLLAGVGAAALVVGARMLAARLAARRAAPASAWRVGSSGALILGALLLTTGSVYAATPPTYESGWYRLYPECEFDAIRAVAEEAGEDTIIMTGDWRTKLVAAAFVQDSDNVHYSEAFFLDQDHRERTTVGLALDGREVIVLKDRHLLTEHPEYDTGFLEGDDWRLLASHCGQSMTRAGLSVYRSEVAP